MCFTPLTVRQKLNPNVSVAVPCGRCVECYARRVSGWSFRLMQEAKVSTSAWFVTLSYDTRFVPISDNGYLTLSRTRKKWNESKKKWKHVGSDLQNFFKRLRKLHPDGVSLRYYACGEYGDKTHRPHYHIILFNARIELIEKAWCIDGVALGNIKFGDVNGASIGYTLKYMSKAQKVPMFDGDDRVAEFAVMSKGLGANYLTNDAVWWHLADLENRMHLTLPDGRKVAMPRFYKDKLYMDYQRSVIAAKSRIKMEQKFLEEDAKLTDADRRNKVEDVAASFRSLKLNNRKKM